MTKFTTHYKKHLLPSDRNTLSVAVGLAQCYRGLTCMLLKIYQLILTYNHWCPGRFPGL